MALPSGPEDVGGDLMVRGSKIFDTVNVPWSQLGGCTLFKLLRALQSCLGWVITVFGQSVLRCE